jgi:hypothetical protein
VRPDYEMGTNLRGGKRSQMKNYLIMARKWNMTLLDGNWLSITIINWRTAKAIGTIVRDPQVMTIFLEQGNLANFLSIKQRSRKRHHQHPRNGWTGKVMVRGGDTSPKMLIRENIGGKEE